MRNIHYNELSDNELFELVKHSDDLAFTILYQRYYASLYLHALKMLSDNEGAQDVVQELFAKIWDKKNELVFSSSIASYLYTSVRNKVLDIFARNKLVAKYQQSLQEFIEKGEFVTDSSVRESELVAEIEKEIADLPPKMRQVFELSRKSNLSYKAIADELDLSEHTVRKHISRAIKKMRSKFDFNILFIQLF